MHITENDICVYWMLQTLRSKKSTGCSSLQHFFCVEKQFIAAKMGIPRDTICNGEYSASIAIGKESILSTTCSLRNIKKKYNGCLARSIAEKDYEKANNDQPSN